MPKTVLVAEKMKSLIEAPISRTEREDKVIKPYRSTVKNTTGTDSGEINPIPSIRPHVADWFLWHSGRAYNTINQILTGKWQGKSQYLVDNAFQHCKFLFLSWTLQYILFHLTKSLLVSVWLSSLPFKRKKPKYCQSWNIFCGNNISWTLTNKWWVLLG